MNFERIWSFIQANNGFFEKMAQNAKISVDIDNRLYYVGEEWLADPFYFILLIFRSKFMKAGPSSDGEYARISKAFYSATIKTPFGKKEYDRYVNFDNKNQSILNALENILNSENGKFKIPKKEYANTMFKNLSADMENVFSGLYMYEEYEARYYTDIYDRITGFEVFLEDTTIYIPVKNENIFPSAFNEDKLRKVDVKSEIDIFRIYDITDDIRNNSVYIPEDNANSLKNVVKHFRAFNIKGEDLKFIYDCISAIYKMSDTNIVLRINGTVCTTFIAEHMIKRYSESGSSSMLELIDAARVVSVMPKIEKNIIIDILTRDLSTEIIDIIKPQIEGSSDDFIAKMSELVTKEHIEFSARMIRASTDANSIRFYNKRMQYFKDFVVDKTGILNDLVPDLGGLRYISSYCGISPESVPAGFQSVDIFVIYVLLKVCQTEFSALPLFNKTCGAGVHMLRDKPVFNCKKGIHGLNGKHSYDGILLEQAEIDAFVPKRRINKPMAKEAFENIRRVVSGFVSNTEKRDFLASILIASSCVFPLLKKSNKATIVFYMSGPYSTDGIKQRIFRGVFRNAIIAKTESDFVLKQLSDGNTSIVAVEMNKSVQKTLKELATERFKEVTLTRYKNSDTIRKKMNSSPLVIFSNNEWHIEESVVFNFPVKVESEVGAHFIEEQDYAGTLAAFCVNNAKKLLTIEKTLLKKAKNNIKKREYRRHNYVDFFEKILSAMCLADILGIIDPWELHDMLYSVYFTGDMRVYDINISKILLEMKLGQSKVVDKIYDSKLRLNQNGDLIAVDKVFHHTYVEREDTIMYVLLFDKRKVFNKLKDDLKISYIEFCRILDTQKNSIKPESGKRNYRLGHDKKKTIVAWYKELFDKNLDEYCALKINKTLIQTM